MPGLGLALLVRFTVREPARGAAEGRRGDDPMPGFVATLRTLLGMRTIVLVLVGASMAALSGYAFAFWGFEFFARVHGLDRPTIGWGLGLITALGGGLGTWAGGQAADRLGRRDPRWYGFVCAIGMGATLPLGAVTFYAADARVAFAGGALFLFAGAAYTGPMYAILQGLAPLRMRTMIAALLFFFTNLIGLGAGPPLVGWWNGWLEPAFGAHAVRHSLALATALNVPVVCFFVLIGLRLRSEPGLAQRAGGVVDAIAPSARESRRA